MSPRPRGLQHYKCLNQAPRTRTPLAFAQVRSTKQMFHHLLSLLQDCQRSNLAETQCFERMRLWQLQQQWKKGLRRMPRVQKPPPLMPLYFSTSFAQHNEDTSRAMHITSSRTSVGDSSAGTFKTARKCSSVFGRFRVSGLQTSPLLTVSTKTP